MNYIDAAETYIENGFNPLPLKVDKSPNLEQGHGFLYNTINDVQRRFKSCGKIGIACGKVSGNLECIDFDGHKGEDIKAIFKAFSNDQFALNIMKSGNVAVYQTPRGGFHVIYRREKFDPCGKLAAWSDGTVMIEIKGNGGYIACDPSPGYKLINKTELVKVSTPIDEDDRNYLVNLAKSFTQLDIETPKHSGNGKWGLSWDINNVFGRYNIECAEEAKDLLLNAGWEMTHTRPDGVEYWRRPDKEKGISATWGNQKNMFYVFTGSAPPFKQETPYSPFDILLLLKFSNDMAKAKIYLNQKYPVQTPQQETAAKPHFPLDVFPANIRAFINEMNRTLNYNRDFLSISVMFTFATLNGNKYKLRVKNGWTAPTIFWFVAVGEPGTMKSHPISTIITPIDELDRRSKKQFDFELNEWEAAEQKGKKPKYKQILISDYTLEALHEVHSHNKRGIGLYKDEIVGFLNDMNKYRKGSDEQFWLESFNNKSYTVNRVSKDPLRIDDININIIGSIQPTVLGDVVKNYAGNGMIDRFLYTAAEDNIYPMGHDDMNQQWFDYWAGLVSRMNDLCRINPDEGSVVIDMPAETMKEMILSDYEFVQMQISDDETHEIKNYLSKMKTYLPRFALLLSLIEVATGETETLEVLPRHMVNAKMLCDYFVASARSIFNEAEKADEITNVSKAMQTMTKAEKIVSLHKKGFKQVEIAKKIKTPASYVSRVLKENKL